MPTICTLLLAENLLDQTGLVEWHIKLLTQNDEIKRSFDQNVPITSYPDLKTAIETIAVQETAIVDKAAVLRDAVTQKTATDVDMVALGLDSTKVVLASPANDDIPPLDEGGGGGGGVTP